MNIRINVSKNQSYVIFLIIGILVTIVVVGGISPTIKPYVPPEEGDDDPDPKKSFSVDHSPNPVNKELLNNLEDDKDTDNRLDRLLTNYVNQNPPSDFRIYCNSIHSDFQKSSMTDVDYIKSKFYISESDSKRCFGYDRIYLIQENRENLANKITNDKTTSLFKQKMHGIYNEIFSQSLPKTPKLLDYYSGHGSTSILNDIKKDLDDEEFERGFFNWILQMDPKIGEKISLVERLNSSDGSLLQIFIEYYLNYRIYLALSGIYEEEFSLTQFKNNWLDIVIDENDLLQQIENGLPNKIQSRIILKDYNYLLHDKLIDLLEDVYEEDISKNSKTFYVKLIKMFYEKRALIYSDSILR